MATSDACLSAVKGDKSSVNEFHSFVRIRCVKFSMFAWQHLPILLEEVTVLVGPSLSMFGFNSGFFYSLIIMQDLLLDE